MQPSVVLVDDQLLVLEALSALLRAEFAILGVYEDGASALAAAQALRPELVLLEVELPRLGGVELVRALGRSNPEVRCVFVTRHADPLRARACLDAGARGYVLKDASPAELVAAARRAAAGGTHVAAQIEALLGPPGRRSAALLTGRQREVLARVAAGMPAKAIACDLGIALKTVEFHKCRISQQLGLRSTAAMTRYAVEHGLVYAKERG